MVLAHAWGSSPTPENQHTEVCSTPVCIQSVYQTPGYTSQGRSHKLHYISTILCCLTWYRVHMDAPLAMLGVRHHGSVFGNSLQNCQQVTLSCKDGKQQRFQPNESNEHQNTTSMGIWQGYGIMSVPKIDKILPRSAKHKYPSN